MSNKEVIFAAAAQNRIELHNHINSMRIEPIDRSIYSKTADEKKRLRKLKIAWKIIICNGYSPRTYSSEA